ncbi:MAG: ATP-binding cassette domain-containing protein [Ruoffia tabacinasalis]|uniref:ATP-binding cassette domain-containing protein n=1 Tax=unclassified Ruoffia TaxID=2862149 RepID=UPI000ECFF78F|nr:hypothetical protein [Aerococcaceae bacterium]
MIQLSDVSIQFEEPILTNVSVTFQEGKIYGLVGANGSGKSSVLRAIARLIKYEGKIEVGGSNVTQAQSGFQKVMYFEHSEWFDYNLTAMDYLKLYSKLWKSEVELKEVVSYWGMEDYVNRKIGKYSLGMRQKLLLSLYALSTLRYLIMDEPTNGLDKDAVILFKQWLEKEKVSGKLIVFTSHYHDTIFELCDAVYEIENHQLNLVDQ